MTDGTSQSTGVQPWRRLGTEAYQRRYGLFVLAAPVFERHGFRGATMRALAHACHLSPWSSPPPGPRVREMVLHGRVRQAQRWAAALADAEARTAASVRPRPGEGMWRHSCSPSARIHISCIIVSAPTL